jgi:DNA polymerase III subunit epsilon
MELLVILVVAAVVVAIVARPTDKPICASEVPLLPERFVVLDLETTGLDPECHEIIEVAALRIDRVAVTHDTFEALVIPGSRMAGHLAKSTGISQELLDSEGRPLGTVLPALKDFVGDLPLVSFNADFDLAFLRKAGAVHGLSFANDTECVLKLARRAWPGRRSYKLADLAREHRARDRSRRALADCRRALVVYCAAVTALQISGQGRDVHPRIQKEVAALREPQ